MTTSPSATLAIANALDEVTARPDYIARAFHVIRKFHGAPDEASALTLLREAAEAIGASSAVFFSVIRIPDHASCRLLLACDPAWAFEYDGAASFANDPWLAYAAKYTEPARASEIPTEHQHARGGLADKLGFRSAVVVPAPSSGRLSRIGMLCLGASQPGYFEADGFVAVKVVARALAMELHEWLIRKVGRELTVESGLTEQDLQLLRHERMGHGTKTITVKLGTSQSSVDSRFQRINAKLDIPTRKAAAQLAAEYGLL